MSGTCVTWIGLGNIGRGMSSNIAKKGPQTKLILYNRTSSRAVTHAENIGSNNVTVAQSLSEAVAASDLIFACVGDDTAIEAIAEEILSDKNADLSGKTFVDCSTVHPDTSRRLEASFTARGAGFVACPVFGAPNMADAGQMIVVPAGKQASIAKATPFFEGVTAKATIDLSDGSGADVDVSRASTFKVLGNSFILNTIGVLAESLTAADATGLGTGPFRQWLELFNPGPFVKYADRMISGDYYQREEPLFAVDLARKDLRHAASLAKEGGQRMRNGEVMDGLLQGVKAEKGEKGDVAAVYGAARKAAGLNFENH
ncbi:Uncharacterized protein PECH_004591 [Penicillium ucsense]|uniref:6-phosphogluconate dehydrogenase NADP-binding domain-containing protein n=1 Tax=Penicillium ucsense TaxID=2839758 RepID=A0A8J8WI89_9EURO|nr:Uncharacterized protein PECM_006187 [Penicillium ucsense]KAF7736935.1 Uncharacterized protein PECH_004591 [Penicillium ucsense]